MSLEGSTRSHRSFRVHKEFGFYHDDRSGSENLKAVECPDLGDFINIA